MHMYRIIAFTQMMVIIGIQLHLELLVSFHQCIDILHRVLYMHIIMNVNPLTL